MNFDEHTQTGIGVVWGYSYVAFTLALMDLIEEGAMESTLDGADPYQPEVISLLCKTLYETGRIPEALYMENHAKESSRLIRFAMAYAFAVGMDDHLSYSAISRASIISGALARLESCRFLSDAVLMNILARITKDPGRTFIQPFLEWFPVEEGVSE